MLYDQAMKRFLAALLLSAFVLGCPSKDNQSSGATSPSGATGAPPAAAGTGPLANLESSPFMNEVWIGQEGGQQVPFVYYSRENVRLSAQCRSATGQLNCDALRQLRGAPPVDVSKRSLTGNISAGTRVCTKLGQ